MGAVPDLRGAPLPEGRLPITTGGRSRGAYTTRDWLLLATVALVFGSSFLLIEVGLRSLAPTVITLSRLLLGAATLALFPRARAVRFRPDDARRVALVGVIWMGVPLMLFPLAQRSIDSSVAGMVNGAMPLLTVVWTVLLAGTMPARRQALGLLLGFLGIVAVSLPEVPLGGLGSRESLLGLLLALAAAAMYGLSAVLVAPLQQRYGSAPVLLRAQLVALVIVTPFAASGLTRSTFTWPSVLAMVPLGVLGTALAFIAVATLIGNVGAPRGAVSIYFVPVVAIVLGIVFLGERVHPLAFLGTGLVIAGAWLTSRGEADA
jgi:drug/metabolite transporter (DMT)-like permease